MMKTATHLFTRMLRCLGFLLIGCVFAQSSYSAETDAEVEEPFILQSGDQLYISFPGAPDLDTGVKVRRDGVITLPLIGEISVKGKTPRVLESELIDLYEDQLVTKEVMVGVLDSQFTFFVEGEVARPGPIVSERQLTALEAVISAGGVDKTNGNSKVVRVIRRKGESYEFFRVDLNAVLEGKTEEAFILEPYDIVSVPRRFW